MNEKIFVSKCCGVEVKEIENDEGYMCPKCNTPCFTGIKIVCAYCLGTGVIHSDEDDGEGHTMRGVGVEKCHCKRRYM